MFCEPIGIGHTGIGRSGWWQGTNVRIYCRWNRRLLPPAEAPVPTDVEVPSAGALSAAPWSSARKTFLVADAGGDVGRDGGFTLDKNSASISSLSNSSAASSSWSGAPSAATASNSSSVDGSTSLKATTMEGPGMHVNRADGVWVSPGLVCVTVRVSAPRMEVTLNRYQWWPPSFAAVAGPPSTRKILLGQVSCWTENNGPVCQTCSWWSSFSDNGSSSENNGRWPVLSLRFLSNLHDRVFDTSCFFLALFPLFSRWIIWLWILRCARGSTLCRCWLTNWLCRIWACWNTRSGSILSNLNLIYLLGLHWNVEGFATGLWADLAGGGTAIGGLLFEWGGTKIVGGVLGGAGIELANDGFQSGGGLLGCLGWWGGGGPSGIFGAGKPVSVDEVLVFFGTHLPLLPLPLTCLPGMYSLPIHPVKLNDRPLGALEAAPCAVGSAFEDPLTRARWGWRSCWSCRWPSSTSCQSWAYVCSESEVPSIRDANVGVWLRLPPDIHCVWPTGRSTEWEIRTHTTAVGHLHVPSKIPS